MSERLVEDRRDEDSVRDVLFQVPYLAQGLLDRQWRDCVSRDVVLVLGDSPEHEGHRELTGLDAFARYYEQVPQRMRFVVNPLVQIDGRSAHASSVNIIMDVVSGAPTISGIERVEDVLEQGPTGRWIIIRRASTEVGQRGRG
ncbi:MAG TPA: nuclear transport factor 2 family protein [Jatrophihabitantaceae bacterium]